MTEVKTTRLYRVTTSIPMGPRRGTVLWLVGSRPSSLGGYIGNFEHTYEHTGNPGLYSPNGNPVRNLPMHLVEPIQ